MFKVNDLVVVTDIRHKPENPEWNQFYGRSGVVGSHMREDGAYVFIYDELDDDLDDEGYIKGSLTMLDTFFTNAELTKIGVL